MSVPTRAKVIISKVQNMCKIWMSYENCINLWTCWSVVSFKNQVAMNIKVGSLNINGYYVNLNNIHIQSAASLLFNALNGHEMPPNEV